MHDFLGGLMRASSGYLESVSALTKTVAATTENREVAGILSYPLSARGHMLRPLLVFLTHTAISEEKQADVPGGLVDFGACVELIHNASLIHDDLLDREETRRGIPCLHKKYGLNNAVLAGNCYYIRALQLSSERLGPDITRAALETAFAMCSGELLQAQYETQPIPDHVYLDIIRAKTAGLTALSCRGAAILAGSGDAGLWEEIGERIGLIYQLKDDAKDGDVNLRPDFDFHDAIAGLIKETDALLEETGRHGARDRFAALVRHF